MYKVFFNDRVIFLASLTEKLDPRYENHTQIIDNESTVHSMTNWFLSQSYDQNLVLCSESIDQLWLWFSSYFIPMDAAGGLVENSLGELLCIHRLNRWDLPKGKVEKGETFEQAAIREVEEECGISGVKLNEFATCTLHGYPHPKKNDKCILKTTRWYYMTYQGEELLRPQISEQIEAAVWASPDQIIRYRELSYASLRPVFDLWLSSSKH